MERYHIEEDLKVFGVHVKSFPQGIGDAFDALVKMLPAGDSRPYYGISQCLQGAFIYNAAALQTFDGEAEKYGCEKYVIEKGEYLSVKVLDWMKKTDSIKYVFMEMFKDDRYDGTKPCIEIYKNDDEMLCLVKLDERKAIQAEFETQAEEFIRLLSSFSGEQINTIPFEGSWTAGQLAEHVTKVNTGIGRALQQEGKTADRNNLERIGELKKMFLDFTTKMQSPDFVLPVQEKYQKETLIADLKKSTEQLKEAGSAANLSEIIKNGALGEITKFEMLYFVVYHTQRHNHQLKNIAQKMGIQ